MSSVVVVGPLANCNQLPCFMQLEEMQPGGRQAFASQQLHKDDEDDDDENDEDDYDRTQI